MEQQAAQVDMQPQFQPVGKKAYPITITVLNTISTLCPSYYLPFFDSAR